jgi:hypothetical protein
MLLARGVVAGGGEITHTFPPRLSQVTGIAIAFALADI